MPAIPNPNLLLLKPSITTILRSHLHRHNVFSLPSVVFRHARKFGLVFARNLSSSSLASVSVNSSLSENVGGGRSGALSAALVVEEFQKIGVNPPKERGEGADSLPWQRSKSCLISNALLSGLYAPLLRFKATKAGYPYPPTPTCFKVVDNSGRVFQIEYAAKAVDNSGTAIGIKCKDGIIMGVEKLVAAKMMLSGSNKRMHPVHRHSDMI